MEELFLRFLRVGISGSVIILLIALIRVVFRKAPKALICLCWTVAILRLMLPFSIETSWSLQPVPTLLTDRVATVQVSPGEIVPGDLQVPITDGQLPTYSLTGLSTGEILGYLWGVGTALMLGYALVSYLRLRKRVGQSVQLSRGVYWCPGLNTAFLFGYFRPCIYLPEADEDATTYIRLHEQAHLRRGDHWLMLFGYFALCLHWFNPLVWAGYIWLRRDIEGACDQRVIRTLDTQQRREYANALLACGKHRSFPVSCPVAFGEISIKQRIMGVLNYRKPTLWICVVLLAVVVGLGVFFLTDQVSYPPHYMELMGSLSEPLGAVCEKLDITEADLLGDGAGNYATPIYVEYADVDFQLYLHTDAAGEGEKLSFFSYYAVFDGSTQEADRAAAAVAHRLYKTYGPGVNAKLGSRPDLYRDITAEEVSAVLGDQSKASRLFEHWDITDSGHGNLDDHLANLRQAFRETDHMAGTQVCYLIRYLVTYDREQNTKTIAITYRNYLSFMDAESGQGGTFATKLNPIE